MAAEKPAGTRSISSLSRGGNRPACGPDWRKIGDVGRIGGPWRQPGAASYLASKAFLVGVEEQPALAAVGADLVEVDQVERLAGEGERVGLPEERFRVGQGSEQAGDARLPAVEGSAVAGLAGLLLHILRAQHGRSLPFLVFDRLFSALDRAHVVR